MRDFILVVVAGLAGGVLAGALVGGADTGVLLAATLVGQYAAHLLALVLVVRRHGRSFADLGLVVDPRDGLLLVAGAALQFAVVFLFLPWADLLRVQDSPQQLSGMLTSSNGALVRTVLIVAIGFIAPLTEELMFRGVLLKVFERWRGRGAAVWGSAGVFALFHLLGLAGSDWLRSAALLMPELLVVGLVLAWLTVRTGRLGPSIFTHAGFNLVALVALFASLNLPG